MTNIYKKNQTKKTELRINRIANRKKNSWKAREESENEDDKEMKDSTKNTRKFYALVLRIRAT